MSEASTNKETQQYIDAIEREALKRAWKRRMYVVRLMLAEGKLRR